MLSDLRFERSIEVLHHPFCQLKPKAFALPYGSVFRDRPASLCSRNGACGAKTFTADRFDLYFDLPNIPLRLFRYECAAKTADGFEALLADAGVPDRDFCVSAAARGL